MLSDDAERYIALRHSLGYKLRKLARHLQSFAATRQIGAKPISGRRLDLAWATAAGRDSGRAGSRVSDI